MLIEVTLYKNLYIKWTRLRFSTHYFTVLPKIYCALKIEVIENLKIFVLFSFLNLRNIKGTYSKYFQDNISETDTLFTAQLSTA